MARSKRSREPRCSSHSTQPSLRGSSCLSMAVSRRSAPHSSRTRRLGKEIYQMKGEVSVIGLGAMGSALARALLSNGHRVTVWNRTSAKAEALVQDGAVLAHSAAATKAQQ